MEFLIVGSGNVGTALGTNLLAHGHTVTYALRDPAAAVVPDGCGAEALDAEAPASTVRVLAVPFAAVAEVVPRLHLPEGCLLVDATNPFGKPVPDGVGSSAELVASLVPDTVSVVKAFNVLGAEQMVEPESAAGLRPILPVASDDERARGTIAALAEEIGFDAVEVGGLDSTAILEAAARYWGLLAFAGGLGRDFVLVADRRRPAVETAR